MPDGVDDLDGEALEIATRYLLDRWTLKQLADRYHRSPATLHRRLAKWLDDSRFELVDTRASQTSPRVVGIDERLSEALSDRTRIWRANVAVVEGAGDAYSEDYLGPDDGVDAQRAFEAHDRLHEAVGQATSSYFATRLRRGMTIGVSSGRGVGFLVMGLAELAQDRPFPAQGVSEHSHRVPVRRREGRRMGSPNRKGAGCRRKCISTLFNTRSAAQRRHLHERLDFRRATTRGPFFRWSRSRYSIGRA